MCSSKYSSLDRPRGFDNSGCSGDLGAPSASSYGSSAGSVGDSNDAGGIVGLTREVENRHRSHGLTRTRPAASLLAAFEDMAEVGEMGRCGGLGNQGRHHGLARSRSAAPMMASFENPVADVVQANRNVATWCHGRGYFVEVGKKVDGLKADDSKADDLGDAGLMFDVLLRSVLAGGVDIHLGDNREVGGRREGPASPGSGDA